MTQSPRTRQLNPRHRQIVEHAIRYRLSTNETIQDLFFADQKPNAVTKVTARLCDWGFLKKFPLVHPRSYFLPGRRAVQEFGVPLARTYPLGPQSLPKEYAVLAYTASHDQHVLRLTVAELRKQFPTFPLPWTETAHCLRRGENPSLLEWVRVDLGGSADHVARKCVADFSARMQNTVSRRLIERGRYRLVLITGTTEKLASITEAIQKHVWPKGLAIHMVAVPDLLPLLPHCGTQSDPVPTGTSLSRLEE